MAYHAAMRANGLALWLAGVWVGGLLVGCEPSNGPAGAKPGGLAVSGENLLINGSFEAGREGWFSIESDIWGPPFQVTDTYAAEGTQSARIIASSADYPAKKVHICGVIQEVSPKEFPRRLRGRYRVNQWRKGAGDLYVQFVVIVFGSDKMPPGLERVTNHQVRYPLAGIDRPPFAIGNGRFVFITKAQPVTGQWVTFERDLHEDFGQQWGAVPTGFSKIRVLFEARWDNRRPGGSHHLADVCFDDLYLGGQ